MERAAEMRLVLLDREALNQGLGWSLSLFIAAQQLRSLYLAGLCHFLLRGRPDALSADILRRGRHPHLAALYLFEGSFVLWFGMLWRILNQMFKVKPQDWLILKNEKKKTSIDWAAEVYCEGGGKGLSLCGFPLALMSLCFTCKSDWLCIIHFELRCSLLINPGCRGKASAVCFYALAFSLLRLQGYPVLHFMLDQSCSVKKNQ